MTYPEVQFVAAPEDGAEVLFDFNDNFGDAPAQIIAGSFSLGTPSVEGDPDGLGVQYGPREVSFSLLVFGDRYSAMQTQALLARTFMLRRRGYLRVRLDDLSSPVWLRTYTPTPGELDFSLIQPDSNEDAWQIEVSVAAEAEIRGARITFPAVTITNNPAAATNPMSYKLPAIVGDFPAPLRITATFSSIMDACDIFWSTAAVPASVTRPIFWQVGGTDGWTAGADTSATTAASDASGGSVRVCTFATTPQHWLRLSGVAPTIPRVGRYRMFVRVFKSTAGATHFKLQGAMTAGLPGSGSPAGITTPVVSWKRSANAGAVLHTWVDLGSFDLPLPRTETDLTPTAVAPVLRLYAERVSGSGNLLFDCFALVPEALAEVTSLEDWEKSSSLVSEFPGVGPSQTEAQVWDGDSESTLRVRTSGALDGNVSGPMRGRFPVVRPGLDNLVTLIGQTRTTDPTDVAANNPDAVTITASAVFSYQPRWLYLGGG